MFCLATCLIRPGDAKSRSSPRGRATQNLCCHIIIYPCAELCFVLDERGRSWCRIRHPCALHIVSTNVGSTENACESEGMITNLQKKKSCESQTKGGKHSHGIKASSLFFVATPCFLVCALARNFECMNNGRALSATFKLIKRTNSRSAWEQSTVGGQQERACGRSPEK